MSFEESLKALADSNLRLAAAMDKYADTITKFGLKVEEANTGKAEETEEEAPVAEKKPRGRPAKAKPEPTPEPEVEDEDDGFGEEEEEEAAIDFAAVKQALKDVAAKVGKEKALKIMHDRGYKAIPEIKEKDYKAVYDAAQKLLK